MLGLRGVPATYGGIERHVEETGSRLAQLGHGVTVYCRSNYSERGTSDHRGMTLRRTPVVPTKHLEALSHTATALFDANLRRYDVLHFHGLGPGTLAGLARLRDRRRRPAIVLTVHGMDFEREKWGPLARALFRGSGRLAAIAPDRTIVVSEGLAEQFSDRYGAKTTYIPNGVTPLPGGDAEHLQQLGVVPGRYVLAVGRLVPEKGYHHLVRAAGALEREGLSLVIAGGSSFTNDYASRLRADAVDARNVHMPGYVYGQQLQALYQHAAAFVQPSTVEGMPLTVLEAMSYGLPILLSDIPVHKQLVAEAGPGRRLFESGSSDSLMQELGKLATNVREERDAAARFRHKLLEEYTWDATAAQTAALYAEVVQSRGSGVRL